MSHELRGKKVAALVTHGFEQSELFQPQQALQQAGADVYIVAPERGRVRGWNRTDWGESVDVDRTTDEVNADDYDALLLPGGVMSPDKLRINAGAVALVKAMANAGKPIAAICHGPWTLIEAGAVSGRRLTSYPSLRSDLRNAGAEWVDEEVVVDRGLVTSRRPDDLPAFNRKMIEEFAEGVHEAAAGGANPGRADS
jgi:protease I